MGVLVVVGVFYPVVYDLVRGREQAEDQALWAEALGDMLEAGIPLSDALEAISTDLRSTFKTCLLPAAGALEGMVEAVKQGRA